MRLAKIFAWQSLEIYDDPTISSSNFQNEMKDLQSEILLTNHLMTFGVTRWSQAEMAQKTWKLEMIWDFDNAEVEE